MVLRIVLRGSAPPPEADPCYKLWRDHFVAWLLQERAKREVQSCSSYDSSHKTMLLSSKASELLKCSQKQFPLWFLASVLSPETGKYMPLFLNRALEIYNSLRPYLCHYKHWLDECGFEGVSAWNHFTYEPFQWACCILTKFLGYFIKTDVIIHGRIGIVRISC